MAAGACRGRVLLCSSMLLRLLCCNSSTGVSRSPLLRLLTENFVLLCPRGRASGPDPELWFSFPIVPRAEALHLAANGLLPMALRARAGRG